MNDVLPGRDAGLAYGDELMRLRFLRLGTWRWDAVVESVWHMQVERCVRKLWKRKGLRNAEF